MIRGTSAVGKMRRDVGHCCEDSWKSAAVSFLNAVRGARLYAAVSDCSREEMTDEAQACTLLLVANTRVVGVF